MRRTQEDTVNQETLLIQQAEGWRFGPFVLWESPRRLERSGAPVRLGTRSIELLLELIKGRNEHLTKEQLLERVWAGADVDEVSVRVHMSTLRKALGPPGDHEGCHEWISTAPMRGYRFIGKVERATSPWPGGPSLSGRSAEHPDHVPCFRPSRLPSPISRLIGRETEIRQLHERLLQRRLVTVAGPGGIGKTCVAVHVARLVQQETGSEVTFVDLAPLVSADHLLSAVAQAVGLPGDGSNSSIAIARGLSGRSLLLLVDNCEHVVTAVARLVEELLVLLPELKVLATSRERLRVQGEHVVRLPPVVAGGPRLQHTTGNALRGCRVVDRPVNGSRRARLRGCGSRASYTPVQECGRNPARDTAHCGSPSRPVGSFARRGPGRPPADLLDGKSLGAETAPDASRDAGLEHCAAHDSGASAVLPPVGLSGSLRR